jgi:hypothetical protein
MGKTQYRVASDHRLAHRYDLTAYSQRLAERFGATRLALNDISERLFSLGDPDYSLEALLQARGAKNETGV